MRNPGLTRLVSRALATGSVLLTVTAALAQIPGPETQNQEPKPARGTSSESDSESEAATAPPPSAVDYFIPDLPPNALTYDGNWLYIRPIIALLPDYTWFEQDDPSLEQVGEQENSPDLRAARFGVVVRSKKGLHWDLFFDVDYQEKRHREDDIFQLYDFRLGIPIGPVKLNIGKQKEPFVLEMVGLSTQSPQQERILSPFFVTRSIGVQLSGQLAGDRMTWTAGWFNDWLESGLSIGENADDYVGRLTGLVAVSRDNLDYLHLGLGLRRVGADAGVMRFSGRPESNVADKYLDTGEFRAGYARQLSIEAVLDRGPFMILAEHVEAWVDASESGNPHFTGSYATVSWLLTGESRPYNRAAGFAGGIVPARPFGSIELVARYSHVNLTAGTIDGGVLGKWHVGVNWWATERWKLGLSYGDADLDRDGILGNTKMVLFRSQWFY